MITLFFCIVSCNNNRLLHRGSFQENNKPAISVNKNPSERINFQNGCIQLNNYFVDGSISIDSINLLLKNNDYPFILSKVILDNYKTDLLKYDDRTCAPIELFAVNHYSPEYVNRIFKIEHESIVYYLIIISEDVVGLDYFLLLLTTPFTVYLSEKYNYDVKPYHFVENSIDFKKKVIQILYDDDEIETIQFKQFEKYPIISIIDTNTLK